MCESVWSEDHDTELKDSKVGMTGQDRKTLSSFRTKSLGLSGIKLVQVYEICQTTCKQGILIRRCPFPHHQNLLASVCQIESSNGQFVSCSFPPQEPIDLEVTSLPISSSKFVT